MHWTWLSLSQSPLLPQREGMKTGTGRCKLNIDKDCTWGKRKGNMTMLRVQWQF